MAVAPPASEVVPVVDLRLLSQAEIHSLALSCPNAYDLRRSDDVVIPKIDPAIFNESAGSRKQTYSRFRLAPHNPDPASPSTVASRRPRGHFSSTSSSAAAALEPSFAEAGNADDDERGRQENLKIISYLRQLFAGEEASPHTLPTSTSDPAQGNLISIDGSDPQNPDKGNRVMVVLEDEDREILNGKGEAVDLLALGQKVDPFTEVLRQRTIGLTTEQQLLDFMSGFDGQWGSRRRKRRIVCASEFGDHLPRGWKLLLSLKRKEGEVWVYCRRYISPSGKQFLSCKEVAAYIYTLLGNPNALVPVSVETNVGASRNGKLNTDYAASLAVPENLVNDKPGCPAVAPFASSCSEPDRQIILYDAQNQKQLSHEQKSAKRRKLGKLVGDGVIIKDGKFECQFCHKVFAERHRYYGHVGTHVRYQGLSAEALLDDNSKTFCNPAPVAALSHDFYSAETPAESSTPITVSEPHFASANMHCQGENHEIDSRKSETTKMPSVVTAHDFNVMDEKDSSCVNGEVAFPIMSHGKVAEDTLMTSSDNQVHKIEENTNGIVKNVEASQFEHDKASDVKNIEVGEVALHIMFHEKVAEDTLMTSDNQDSDYHHAIEENTDGTDVQTVEASHFKDSSDAKNIEVGDINKVDTCGIKKIDDHDCNDDDCHFGNVQSNSLQVNDVDSKPCLDVTYIAPNDVPNIACEAANKVAQFFPESMSVDGCKTNDSDLIGIIPESNVDATDNIAFKTNNPLNFILMSHIDVDKTVLGRSNGREMSPSVVISDAEKCGTEHRLESENQLITLSANGPNYAIGKDATDAHVRNTEESYLVEMVKSCRKNESASSNVFTVGDNARSILPLDFNASYTNMPFVSRSSGDVDKNRVRTFDIDMKECMLGDIDEPNVELDRCFNGSSAANNSFHDSENSLGFDFSLGSPWLRSSDHIPDVDMNPDQNGEDLNANSQKSSSSFTQLTLSTVETSEFDNLTRQDSIPAQPPIELHYEPELDHASVHLGWDISLQNSMYELTSVCVWCGREFRHASSAANSGEASDTLGFICPTCKAKISGL
ncbi:uncharacterized protein LOC141833685 isoform X2 [Curcuma longa]|uniref:uncharacterized protein LOC141833685 isoform X2 n=1 Tax=Curcuma longa TaxID=136217 RepID=UPI003D9DD308